MSVTYILRSSVDGALQYPGEVCSWMLAAPCARASDARRVISPGCVDGRMLLLLLMLLMRPAKAETTHLRDAATAFLKGTGTKCSKVEPQKTYSYINSRTSKGFFRTIYIL